MRGQTLQVSVLWQNIQTEKSAMCTQHTHSGERPYECHVCQMTFKTKKACIKRFKTHPKTNTVIQLLVFHRHLKIITEGTQRQWLDDVHFFKSVHLTVLMFKRKCVLCHLNIKNIKITLCLWTHPYCYLVFDVPKDIKLRFKVREILGVNYISHEEWKVNT